MTSKCLNRSRGGSRGGQSGHGPPSKLAMEFGHPRGQKE